MQSRLRGNDSYQDFFAIDLHAFLKYSVPYFPSKKLFLALMPIQHIAGYKFVDLYDLPARRLALLEKCQSLALKGTVLLSEEGININLSGEMDAIITFKQFLWEDPLFKTFSFRESHADFPAYQRLKIKIKKEIIALRKPELCPTKQAVPIISPEELKKWLDEKRDFRLVDTRNQYEINYGTFKNALNLQLADFGDFITAAEKLSPAETPIVIFCTGGIRCEKAGLHLLNLGHATVYQLEGGILNYFAKEGGAHYQGDCFVFDDRVALNEKLRPC